MDIVKKSAEKAKQCKPCCAVDHYVFSIAKTDGDTGRATWAWTNSAETKNSANSRPIEEIKVNSVMCFPGNLTLPRREVYKGEEDFGGQIEYAMFGNADYEDVRGKAVCIVGHGAFAVENVRTCCEFKSGQIYLVCRRKNISCPRVVSWYANRSLQPLSASLFLRAMKPMYDLMNYNVFDYYGVNANANRKNVMISQKARFGIGDVYFVAGYYGKVEVIVDPGGIKRVAHHEVTLCSGRKLNCQVMLKLLGFVGEPDNDKLMNMKEMVGFWAHEDPKRYIVAEPVSVMATNIGSTSFSPGAITWATIGVYYQHYPWDFQDLTSSLPRHSSDDSDQGTYRPAYVMDARHGQNTILSCTMTTPTLAELIAGQGLIKPVKQRLCHPIKQYVEEAKADWDHYCQQFIADGYDKPYPEYPFSVDLTRALVMQHMHESGEPALASDLEDLDITANDIDENGMLKEQALERYRDLLQDYTLD